MFYFHSYVILTHRYIFSENTEETVEEEEEEEIEDTTIGKSLILTDT